MNYYLYRPKSRPIDTYKQTATTTHISTTIFIENCIIEMVTELANGTINLGRPMDGRVIVHTKIVWHTMRWYIQICNQNTLRHHLCPSPLPLSLSLGLEVCRIWHEDN